MLLTKIFSQEIPNEFLEFKLKKIYQDCGIDWHKNSTFGPIRYNLTDNKIDSLVSNTRFGLRISNNQKILYGYAHFTFKQNFFGYLYPRIVDNPNKVYRYSGIPMDIKRGGFSSGETDISGICFQNKWMIIQYGRGRQSWGAGNNIQLALSEESNSYDYGMLDLDFSNLKVRYFHGYLETDTLSVNRYITGRGIEWNNNFNMLIGLSEVIIYSGENRPIDFSYFNPISTHLELELNERPNQSGTDGGNGIWQFSFDYFLLSKIRVSFNYLFDEFIFDKEQRNQGKGGSTAFSFRSVFTPIKNEKSIVSCYVSTIGVGTNTFRHEDGYNNFVQRNNPLGWLYGSDSRENIIGINWAHKNMLLSKLEIGNRQDGEKNFINDLYSPYTTYLQNKFPSGNFENLNFISYEFNLWLKEYLSIFGHVGYYNSNKIGSYSDLSIGIDMYYPMSRIF
ncbi:MAG: hypothetical protein ACJZ12_01535 [Candidatus Neomarinimicrobiota bacterium]